MKYPRLLPLGSALLLVVCIGDLSHAQKITPVVINSNGGTVKSGNLQLDYSVGEMAVTSLTSASDMITVGVEQPSFAGIPFLKPASLAGKLTPQNQVVLNWGMLQPTAGNFDIEKSADGQSFTKMLTVTDTAAIAEGPKNYTAADPSPYTNVTYYRLKQTGDDGQAAYSNTIAIATGAGNSFLISPNPFAASITIRSAAKQPYQVKIFDMGGRLVKQESFAGDETSVNLATLAKGMYIVQLFTKQGASIQSIKITKQ